MVVLDNFVTGSKDNVAHLLDKPTFTLVEADISDGLPQHPAMAERFDAILHMASPASPTDFEKLPVEILRSARWPRLRCWSGPPTTARGS